MTEPGKPLRTIVVFSGAGLSAESGVPTFRDSNGLWESHAITDVASPEGWERNPETVLRFYEARFHGVSACEPNDAHRAIAELGKKFNVVNITQNIDDLLERAGCKKVVHLHGSLFERKCEKHHSCTVLDGDINYQCDYLVRQTEPVKLGDLCPKCGANLRPNVVWFGEAVDMRYQYLQDLLDIAMCPDGVFIVVGTSAQVYPAAGLIDFFNPVLFKYFVDKNPPDKLGNYKIIAGPAGEELPKLVKQLLES